MRSHPWLQDRRRQVAKKANLQLESAAVKLGFMVRMVARLRPARRKIATGVLAAFTVWVGLHVMFGPNGTVTYRAKRTEAGDLQQQINGLQKENTALSQQINALRSDPKAIEKEAREQLHYAKPDEVIYVAPYQERTPTPAIHSAQK